MILFGVVALVFLVAGAVVIFLHIANRAMIRTDTPVEQRVADLTDRIAVATIVWPNARGFNFVLGFPATQQIAPDTVSGSIAVTEGSNTIASVRIGPAATEACNWLESKHNLSAIILTWKLGGLFENLRAGHRYAVQFIADRDIDQASLWLAFLQSPVDGRQAAHRTKLDPYGIQGRNSTVYK